MYRKKVTWVDRASDELSQTGNTTGAVKCMSRRFIFGTSAIRVWTRVRALLLSDLSYSPDLALTIDGHKSVNR